MTKANRQLRDGNRRYIVKVYNPDGLHAEHVIEADSASDAYQLAFSLYRNPFDPSVDPDDETWSVLNYVILDDRGGELAKIVDGKLIGRRRVYRKRKKRKLQ
jgi:hypothetical protein